MVALPLPSPYCQEVGQPETVGGYGQEFGLGLLSPDDVVAVRVVFILQVLTRDLQNETTVKRPGDDCCKGGINVVGLPS